MEAVPAYNLDKFREPGQPYHPRDAGHVGYIVALDGVRYYHAGDTDAVPEMAGVALRRRPAARGRHLHDDVRKRRPRPATCSRRGRRPDALRGDRRRLPTPKGSATTADPLHQP